MLPGTLDAVYKISIRRMLCQHNGCRPKKHAPRTTDALWDIQWDEFIPWDQYIPWDQSVSHAIDVSHGINEWDSCNLVTHGIDVSRGINIGCLRFTKVCWAGKHKNITIKPSNSPTQGQPNPRKISSKVAFGPTFFPQRIVFRGFRIGFIQEIRLQET